MREIDIETWPRREHFRFFMRMDYPQYNLCFDVDVSRLVPLCRERGLSFYYALLYYSTLAANAVEAFRYRVRGDKVVCQFTLDLAALPKEGDVLMAGDLLCTESASVKLAKN